MTQINFDNLEEKKGYLYNFIYYYIFIYILLYYYIKNDKIFLKYITVYNKQLVYYY